MTLTDVLETISERIHRSACPIYEDDATRPLVGSSILLRVGPAHFLVTAKHVFDSRGSLYIWAKDELVGLEGELHFSEAFDFAFMRLKPELVERLQDYRVVEPKDVEIDDDPEAGRLYAFVGLPETQNRVRDRKLKRTLVAFFVTPADPGAYKALELSSITHFVAVFERDRLKTPAIDGTMTGPLPQGMSGGPVWRYSPRVAGKRATLKVIGLGIAYHRAKRVLVAVRLHLVMASILHFYPELASDLALPRQIKIITSTER